MNAQAYTTDTLAPAAEKLNVQNGVGGGDVVSVIVDALANASFIDGYIRQVFFMTNVLGRSAATMYTTGPDATPA